MRGIGDKKRRCSKCARQRSHLGKGGQKRGLSCKLTNTTVIMDLRCFFLVFRLIGLLRLMLMTVMAEVGSRLILVLAIGGRRCPGILERQHYQQKNKKEPFHKRNFTSVAKGPYAGRSLHSRLHHDNCHSSQCQTSTCHVPTAQWHAIDKV